MYVCKIFLANSFFGQIIAELATYYVNMKINNIVAYATVR